jgi:6-phosphogluconolactonase
VAEVLVLTSEDPVSEAARILAAALSESDASAGAARLAIPGGSALGAVGATRRRLTPDVWRRLRLTWIDERCVPFDHADSNRGQAYRTGQLDPTAPTAFELPLFLGGEDSEAARRRVEDALRRDFSGALDVLLLGMGEDGHVASLFPEHHALQANGLVATVLDSPRPPRERLTLTLPALRTARVAVLLVTGEAKRPILERLLDRDPRLPAAALRNVTIVTDLKLGDSR